jgi:signal transduction histidine kinase
MIKKFRIRFITITMTALLLLLLTIMMSINTINYSSVTATADQTLATLATNDGRFDNEPDGTNPPPEEQTGDTSTSTTTQDDTSGPPSGMTERKADPNAKPSDIERPFDTRYFYVKFENGTITDVDVKHISAINNTKAQEIATSIYNGNSNQGYYETVYRYLKHEKDASTTFVIVMDNSKQLEPTLTFFRSSLLIAGVGVLISFVAVFFLSKYVVRPLIISNEMQKRFITDAGHEMKTPLTIISANNELIELQYGESEETKVINRQVARMTEMVKNLSALAKMEKEEVDVEFKEFNLSDALLDAIDTFKTTYQKQDKQLVNEVTPDIIVKANESSIRNLISILMDNALKYSLTKTVVHLDKDHNKVTLIVSNDASDIKPGNLDKVFDRFYRSEDARGSTIEGSGIGLSIAAGIASKNKIKITAYGSEDSIFNIKVTF